MDGYLGEKKVDIKNTTYKNYKPKDWALMWIQMYGQIDGDHHKLWVLDQVVRILNGTPIIMKIASWDNGQTEERFELGESPKAYDKWVENYKDGEDGPDTYGYDEGVAP